MEIKGKYNTAKVFIDDIDQTTYTQILTFLNDQHFENTQIRIMPDTHAGKGSVVGFTIDLTKRICPNTIGVDIGCGMVSVKVGKELKQTLEIINKIIRDIIPLGFKRNASVKKINRIEKYKPEFNFRQFDDNIEEVCKRIKENAYDTKKAIGTLGGGNHFIEIGKDEDGNYWLTVHTGSRHFGKVVCEHWMKQAWEYNETLYEQKKKEILESVPDTEKQGVLKQIKDEFSWNKDLCFLSEDQTKEYLKDMVIAQKFAQANRYAIIDKILISLQLNPLEIIESTHNYIDFTDNIVRKGAITAYKGQKSIIPFNMRDGILICEGKSNKDWNFSAPHGAGRVLSRGQAKQLLKMEDFEKQMEGIYSTSVNKNTLDEAPDAYKDCKVIEDAIKPTATILNRIKPVLNIKA